MASKRRTWNSIGKYFSALVIAAFFLPFFGVSCDGMDVITVSGADMVGGCRPGGLISEAENQADSEMGGSRRSRGGGGMSDIKVDKVEVEPLAIVALALIVLGFGAAFVKSRQGLMASFGLSIATLGVLVGLWIKVGGELRTAIDEQKMGGLGGEMKKDVKVSAGGRYGLWLSGLLLLSIAIMTGRAMREPENMPDLPPGPPPPV